MYASINLLITTHTTGGGRGELPPVRPITEMCNNDGESDHSTTSGFGLNVAIHLKLFSDTQTPSQYSKRDTAHALHIAVSGVAIHWQEIAQGLAECCVASRLRVEIRNGNVAKKFIPVQNTCSADIWRGKHEFAQCSTCCRLDERRWRFKCLVKELEDWLVESRLDLASVLWRVDYSGE